MYMTAIIDRHPLRRRTSRRIHRENITAIPMEMEEMIVRARGGVYGIGIVD